MAATFDPYYKWLGILPKDQPPHHYRLLGLEIFEEDLQVIEAAADRQLGFLRRYQSGEHAADCQRLLNEVSRARLCLLKTASKAAYDADLRRKIEVEKPPSAISADGKSLGQIELDQGLSRRSGKRNLPIAAVVGVALLGLVAVGMVLLSGKAQKPLPPRPGVAEVTSAKSENSAKVKGTLGLKKVSQSETASSQKGSAINILPLLKAENVVTGNWKIESNRLESSGYTQYGQIALPVDVPEEYTLHVRGTRLAAPEAPTTTVGFVLSCGRDRTLFAMESLADKGSSGLHLLDSAAWNNNPTLVPGFQTEIGKPFDLDAIVRKNAIEVRVNGRTIVDWRGNPFQLILGVGWSKAPAHRLTLAAESNYVFTQLTLGPPLPRREFPGSDLKPGEIVELLPSVNLKRDVWEGTIVKEGDALKTDTSYCCRFGVPFKVPDEYVLTADIETALPAREFHFGLPVQGGFLGTSLACMDGSTNYLAIDGILPQYSPDRFLTGHLLTAPRTTLVFEVRNSHVVIKIGDKTIFNWRGDTRRLKESYSWGVPGSRVTFGSNKFSYKVHSLTLKRLAPSPSPFPSPAIPNNGDLLSIVDLERDTFCGFWATRPEGPTSWPDLINGFRVPAKLPRNYEFRLLVERKSGKAPLSINIPVNQQSVAMTIDGDEMSSAGIEFVNGARFNANPTVTRYAEPKFAVGVPQIIQGRVQEHRLQLDIDGKPFFDFTLPPNIPDPSWGFRPGWLTPEERLQLALTTTASFQIGEIRYRGLEADSPEFPPLDIVAIRAASPSAATVNGPSAATVAPKGLPVPETAALQAANKKIHELFADDFKKKKDPDQLALASKLQKLADDTPDDPAAKYVCLDLARSLAVDVGDVSQAFVLIEVMDTLFQIDVPELKVSTIKALAPKVKGPLLNKELLDEAVPLVDELIAAEKSQQAVSITGLIVQLALKTKDKLLQSDAGDLKRETDEWAKSFEIADAARKSLESQPDNADAKVQWGRWLCLRKGNWSDGLKMLAASSHPELKSLAEQDLKNPTANPDIIKLGTAWTTFAESQKDNSESRFADRGIFWLQKVLDQASGVERERAEEQLEKAVAARHRNSLVMILLEQVEKKVAQRRYTRLSETPHNAGIQFESISDPPGILIGLNCSIADFDYSTVIQGIQPVYFTKLGPRPGAWHGTKDGGRIMEVRARPGYACNGLSSQVRQAFDNTQMSFARITRSGLDPQRIYFSPLLGLDPRHSATPFVSMSSTQPIVGLFGHADKNLRGLGIISANK